MCHGMLVVFQYVRTYGSLSMEHLQLHKQYVSALPSQVGGRRCQSTLTPSTWLAATGTEQMFMCEPNEQLCALFFILSRILWCDLCPSQIKHTYVCACIPPEAEPITRPSHALLDLVMLQLILSASLGALAPDVQYSYKTDMHRLL